MSIEILSIIILLILTQGFVAYFLIRYLNKQNAPLRTTVFMSLGIIMFIPAIIILAILGKMDITTSTLLGVFAGYIFSRASEKGEW